ncbi:MAG: hypothetical protein P8Y72_02390 [Anaerolineales bacterium]|jgi:photosystem II stability/assembly factor-like uncharacterized protein
MPRKFLAVTDRGILTLVKKQNNWVEESSHLQNLNFTSVAVSTERVVLAGTKTGLVLSSDGGNTWRDANQGLSHLHLRSLAFHPENPSLAYAGTEPAAIFFSKDGGSSWQECMDVANLREKNRWYLPYSPEAGCIRGFAFSNGRGYAAVEVGGMLISDDFGESWQLTQESNSLNPKNGEIHADVHRVFIHQKSPNNVIAPTGGGFFVSKDQGLTWDKIHRAYCRSVWVDPEDLEHMILGPASGPDRNGRIEKTSDGGSTWDDRSAGLETPWERTMVEHFTPIDDDLFAVLSNGRLIQAPIAGAEWKTVLPETKRVRAVAALP